jgi:Zn-dependent membrane protease YugP
MIILSEWTLWFMLPGLLLGFYAQMKLRSTYGRYARIGVASRLSGAEAAREILNRAGLSDLPIREVPGHLSDHYDPIRKGLFLSSENFHGRSLAALGVAAHEAGHALQHQAAYKPLQIRMALVPVTNFASNAAMWIVMLGWIMGFGFLQGIAPYAIAVFGAITLFHLVTLPVEFDASRRAKDQLVRLGLISSGERSGISRVLNAAAMTYVAAMVASLSQLLHIILITRGGGED